MEHPHLIPHQSGLTSRSEHVADGLVHLLGVVAGPIAVLCMLAAALANLSPGATASLAIYGAALVAMFGCSAAYNMSPSIKWRPLLQRLDHAAIFLKIAGTYTPFAVLKIEGWAGVVLLGIVWTVALGGAAGKLLLASTWDKVAIPLYLALGWVGVVMYEPIVASVGSISLVLLAAGGLLYSLGVIFHVWHSLPYQKAIWHSFVLAATACHFAAVTTAVFVT